MKYKTTKDVTGEYYWLAINGASATLMPVPVTVDHLGVSPTPENLIGFRSLQEAEVADATVVLSSPVPAACWKHLTRNKP